MLDVAIDKVNATMFVRRYAMQNAPRLLVLHGWGFDGAIWEEYLADCSSSFDVINPDLPGFAKSSQCHCDYSDTELIEYFRPYITPQTYIIGWSLGGNIALLLAKHFPAQVRGVVCLATNPKFLAESGQHGMAAETLEQFMSGFKRSPHKTQKMFVGLNAMGDNALKAVRAFAMQHIADGDTTTMLNALAYLKRVDQVADVLHSSTPSSFIFAGNDCLVPVAVAEDLRQQGLSVDVVEGVGHLLPYHVMPQAFATVAAMHQSYGHPIDKQSIANSFSRAAETYNTAASLQKRVADNTLKLLGSTATGTVMDLGCGTGYCLEVIAKGADLLIGFDIAEGMLRKLSSKTCHAVAGDAENLPFADASIDVVFSSLAIQWCQRLDRLFSEIYRVLKPGGRCVFSTFGPESLGELRAAWWNVDRGVHVNGFAAWDALESNLQPLHIKQHQYQVEVIYYAHVVDLMRDLKGIGANSIDERKSGLRGSDTIKRLQQSYQRFQNDEGMLPASYAIHYVELQK